MTNKIELKEKVLIGFGSYNAPYFLEHLVESFSKCNPGYPCDLFIVDNDSTDGKQLNLLNKYSKQYNVFSRENLGRAQGAYNFLWQNNQNYKYYFFMHDDSGFIKDNWLKFAVDRIEDMSVEQEIEGLGLENLPIGKVGFRGYEWQDKYKYLRTGFKTLFDYMDDVADILKVKIPEYYQHLGDDRVLYKNELLKKMNHISNIEDFRSMNESKVFKTIHNSFYSKQLLNLTPFAPNDIYGWKYHSFQTVTEFLNDIAPMRYGFRTHVVDGPGYCQEELGFNSFWGNDYISHYGDHVVFKRLAAVTNTSEEDVRAKFKNKLFLNIVDSIIKRESR
jgi:hypothetical protein